MSTACEGGKGTWKAPNERGRADGLLSSRRRAGCTQQQAGRQAGMLGRGCLASTTRLLLSGGRVGRRRAAAVRRHHHCAGRVMRASFFAAVPSRQPLAPPLLKQIKINIRSAPFKFQFERQEVTRPAKGATRPLIKLNALSYGRRRVLINYIISETSCHRQSL